MPHINRDDPHSGVQAEDLSWSQSLGSMYLHQEPFSLALIPPAQSLKGYSQAGISKRGFSATRLKAETSRVRKEIADYLFQ